MTLVAGVDSSTQSVKVVVCDLDSGEVIREGRAPHPPGTDVPASAWLAAYRLATEDSGLLDGVSALAVAGQQHGMVTLDESGNPVREALLWNDNRSATDADDLIAELGGRQNWADAVGSVPVASMTVAKLRWLARVEPHNAERTASVVLPHDWLTWHIADRRFDPVTDRGDASGTCYFDATTNQYRQDLVQLALEHELHLPRVAGPHEIIGYSRNGIALAPGTGDNMAAGLGLDITTGSAAVSLGTSGTAFTRSTRQTHEPTGTVAGFADATGAFMPPVCTLNGARNLVATARLLGVTLTELSDLALTAPAGSQGLSYIPYLAGERTPPLPGSHGELVGMTLENLTPANVARASIEGVLWSLAYGLDVLREETGLINTVTLTGGAAQSEAVQRIAVAVFGVPVIVTDAFESVAIGAARQAAWSFTGRLPTWQIPLLHKYEPGVTDSLAAQNLGDRYRHILATHYGVPSRGQAKPATGHAQN